MLEISEINVEITSCIEKDINWHLLEYELTISNKRDKVLTSDHHQNFYSKEWKIIKKISTDRQY